MADLERAMHEAGLEVLGCCENPAALRALQPASAFLQDFRTEELQALGALMLRVRAQPGQRLIEEGAAEDWLMVLMSGTVDVGKRKIGAESDRDAPGDVTRLAVLREGAVLGEMSMFDGEPRYASCWALSEVEAGVLDRGAVQRLIETRPDVGAKLLVKLTQLLAQRLRNTSSQLVRVLRQRG